MRLSEASVVGDKVVKTACESLGKVDFPMIDLDNGPENYAVLSHGGVPGIGDKLFAVPIEAMSVNTGEECLTLAADEGRLRMAPGFGRNQWPNMASAASKPEVRIH